MSHVGVPQRRKGTKKGGSGVKETEVPVTLKVEDRDAGRGIRETKGKRQTNSLTHFSGSDLPVSDHTI